VHILKKEVVREIMSNFKKAFPAEKISAECYQTGVQLNGSSDMPGFRDDVVLTKIEVGPTKPS
jgi:hypothetical protein